MRSLAVTPFIPVLEKQTFGDVGFDLAIFGFLVLGFVALICLTFRIYLRAKRDPLSVTRPHGTGTAT